MVAMTSHISHPAFGMQSYPYFSEILVLFLPPKNIDLPRYDISGSVAKDTESISTATLGSCKTRDCFLFEGINQRDQLYS